MLKVSLGGKFVKNTFNERLILVKVREKNMKVSVDEVGTSAIC